MQGNGYVVGFAFGICVVCSLMLSGVSSALKDRQEENRVLDRQKNILVALGFDQEKVGQMDRATVKKTYDNNVEEMVVDFSGNVVGDKKPSDLPSKVAAGEAVDKAAGLALYARKDPTGAGPATAYAYPVTGKGLWSTLYGYLAVKPDGSEVVGLTFYKHGETPGLGAEIEQPWFRKNFEGKKLYDGQTLAGIEVVKGLAADKPSFKTHEAHMVDGISGATLTGNGVTKLMKVMPGRYEPFFRQLAASGGAKKASAPPRPEPMGDPEAAAAAGGEGGEEAAPGEAAPGEPAPGEPAPTDADFPDGDEAAAPAGEAPADGAAPAAADTGNEQPAPAGQPAAGGGQ